MSRHRPSPVVRVVLLACTLLAAAALLLANAPGGTAALHGGSSWIVVAVGLGHLVAERAVFHIEHRREAITISLSEVPSFFALVYIDLRLAILARIVGGLAPMWLARRPPAFKLLMNASVFAFETALAGVLLRAVLDETGESATSLLAAGVVVVAGSTVIGSLALAIAISQFEGGFLRKVSGELRLTWWMMWINASVAALIVTPSLVAPELTPFAFFPLGAFWLFVRRQADVGQELRDVRALHGFSGRVSAAIDLDDIARLAVREASELLRASSCALFVADGGSLRLVASIGDDLVLPDDVVTDPSVPIGRGELCAAPLSADGAVHGVLVVAGREGVLAGFTDADAARLRTVADQLAAPVARGILHRRLEHEASHDHLTGLGNRGSLERSLADRLEGPRNGVTFVAVVDLDRFKEVNDTLGHHAGDELLVEVARRLERVVDDRDVLARFAGDEFGIVGVRDDVDAVDRVARECAAAIGRPVGIDGLQIVVTASVGVATDSPDQQPLPDTATMLRRADIAMYHAKQHHLGHDHYRPEIDRRTPARLSLLADLRAAIDDGDIELHFQPKLDLRDGTVCGAEVLARWFHPQRGAVPPDDFIAVAEQSGLIRALTDHVLAGAVRAVHRLDRLALAVPLAVNLSAHDLLDELLCDRIERHLDEHGVDASRLALEITESTLLYDSPRSRANLDRLHRLGIGLSIDDFGTGYSSLSYLRRLPVSEIKVDRSFVTDLLSDTQDETIVRSTIDLGHNLGLRVVAEGVESDEVIARLRTLGCDVAQGYGICRPVPLDRFTDWLTERTATVRTTDGVSVRGG